MHPGHPLEAKVFQRMLREAELTVEDFRNVGTTRW